MPNYDYVCLDCGHEFECFQRMSEAPLTTCGSCAGRLKRRIGTGAGFLFKGAPVSETDYRLSKTYLDGAKKEKQSPAGDSGDAAAKPAAAVAAEAPAKPKVEKAEPAAASKQQG